MHKPRGKKRVRLRYGFGGRPAGYGAPYCFWHKKGPPVLGGPGVDKWFGESPPVLLFDQLKHRAFGSLYGLHKVSTTSQGFAKLEVLFYITPGFIHLPAIDIKHA